MFRAGVLGLSFGGFRRRLARKGLQGRGLKGSGLKSSGFRALENA